MNLDNFYYLEYSDYLLRVYCNIDSVSDDTSFGIIQIFLVELESLPGASIKSLYLFL